MEFDVDVSILTEKGRLEEKIEMLHKTIRDLSLQKIISSVVFVGKKVIQRTHVDIKQSELYKLSISTGSVKKSPNT